MSQERIQINRSIPKQRRPQEHYEAPFPVPEPELKISDELIDKMLEKIDEATND